MQRRKLSNLILDPASLFRVSIPFILLAVVSVTMMITIQTKVMRALESVELQGEENLPAMNSLHQLQETVTRLGTIGVVIFCVFSLALWVFFSHRLFGPMVPIRRHVARLIEGDYTSRISARAGDEFQDLAADLNRLAETLAKRGH